jgi:hypothetical protein
MESVRTVNFASNSLHGINLLTISRSATLTNSLFMALSPQEQRSPKEGSRIIFRVQIPPLPIPVNASTPDNPWNTQYSLENVTYVQPEKYRIAWKFLFIDSMLESERWSAFSTQNGKAVYESRDVFHGALAGLLQSIYGSDLQKAFEAQGQALKLLLEK